MNAAIRKIYSLPGVWQLFTVPVMTASFTMAALKKSAAQANGTRLSYLLFGLVCLVELAALGAWNVIHFSGYAAPYELAAGAIFGVSGLVLVTWSCLFAWQRKAAFREFLLQAGYTEERVGLTAVTT